MKSEDLMSGDWIIAEGVAQKVLYPFDSDGFTVTCIDGKNYNYLIDSDLNPVPITKEILEKNGFKKRAEEDVRSYWGDGFFVYYDFSNNKILIESDDDGKYSIFFITKDLHKLQQALRLCEIEKEIEL